MKRFLKVFLAIVMLLSAVALASCGDASGDDGTASEGKMVLSAVSDLSEFTIIRGDNSSKGETDAAVQLKKLLSEKFSADLKISTDFNGDKGKEILVGHTSRQASKNAEADVDSLSEYVIRRTGDKIVIMAGSDEALMTAVNFWVTSMVNRAGELCIPNDEKGYIYSRDDIKFDALTVDGISASEFAIYYKNSVFSSVANELHTLIYDYSDIKLDVSSNPNSAKHLIVLDGSNDDSLKSFAEVKDGNIYITASYYDTDFALNYIKSVFDAAPEGAFDITASINTETEYELSTFYDKEDLMAVLETVYNSDEIIVGTEIGSHATVVEDTLENYYEKSGEYPGILGLDVRQSNLNKLGEEGRAKVIADLTNYASQGGIITASAHFSNPKENGGDPNVENYRGSLGGDDAWAELITEGTEYNTAFKKELEGIADFFEQLRDNGVPVIWRPLHETNASWFWFCMVQKVDGQTVKISEESFANLWIYIHDYFTIERGLDNLLWEFGPNIGAESAEMTAPLYGFPGKDYVDLVGFDWYTNSGDASVIETTPTYSDLASLDMIINLNEFGPSGDLVADEEGEAQADIFSCRSILGLFEGFKRDGYKLGYFLTWTSHLSIPELGYADEFMASELTLGLAEVKALFDGLK